MQRNTTEYDRTPVYSHLDRNRPPNDPYSSIVIIIWLQHPTSYPTIPPTAKTIRNSHINQTNSTSQASETAHSNTEYHTNRSTTAEAHQMIVSDFAGHVLHIMTPQHIKHDNTQVLFEYSAHQTKLSERSNDHKIILKPLYIHHIRKPMSGTTS